MNGKSYFAIYDLFLFIHGVILNIIVQVEKEKSMLENEAIRVACFCFTDETTTFLDRIVRFESLAGYEGSAMQWIYKQFDMLTDIYKKIHVPGDIVNDPEHSSMVDRQ